MADNKKPEERISLSPTELADIIKTSVASTIQGLQAPAKAAPVDPFTGMTPQEKEEFERSFGSGRCPECKQPAVKGRYACKGKHVKMVVYPEDEFWGKYFQGVFVNGAKYLSAGPGDMVTVPADNAIAYEVQKWVNMERENAHGKRKSHNSGSIGRGNTAGFNPFNGAGFK